ncbi:MAG: TetR family transcriptional regulator [Novosphingobium sp.]|nr:TetR family transcriptional regulator [Novosphingobium sp.]
MIAAHQNEHADAPDTADSKVQLILAGEKLFAERGVEAASLREIASAAGHGNNNAVRYHFGSKLGLIQAIFSYRVAQMEPVRAHLLAKLEAEGLLADARSLLELIMLPYFTLRAPDGTFSYPGFMLQYLLYYRPKGVRHVADEVGALSPALNRAQSLLRARVSYLDYETADRRILHAMLAFIAAVINAENQKPRLTAERYRALIDDTISHIEAALIVPQQIRRNTISADALIAPRIGPASP